MRIVFHMALISFGLSLSIASSGVARGQCPPIPEGALPQFGKLSINAFNTRAANKRPTTILAGVYTPQPPTLVERYSLENAIPAVDAGRTSNRFTALAKSTVTPAEDFKGPIFIGAPGPGVASTIIEQNGKVLLVGGSDAFKNGVNEQGVFLGRFELNGLVDPTFGQGGHTRVILFAENRMGNNSAVATALAPSGRIVIARTINDRFPGNQPGMKVSVARFEENGALDPTFGTGGIIYTTIDNYFEVFGVEVQRDEKIVVAGRSGHTGSCQTQPCAKIATLMRYLPNGQPDPSFGNAGLVKTQLLTEGTPPLLATESAYTSVRVQENGLIVAVGSVDTDAGSSTVESKMLVAEYLPTGEINPAFGNSGAVTLAFGGPYQRFGASSLVIQENGRILAGGSASLYSVAYEAGTTVSRLVDQAFILARLTAGGELDSTFASSGKLVVDVNPRNTGNPPRPLDSLSKVLVAPTGHIYVIGLASGPVGNSERAINLVSINRDGSLDQSFGSTGLYSFGTFSPWGIELAQDGLLFEEGRLLVSGVHWPDAKNPDAFVLWGYSMFAKPKSLACP